MVDLLLLAAMVGATSSGVTLAVRALPWVDKQLLQAKKPWVCDICMSFWTVGALVLGVAAWHHEVALVFLAGPAYPVALGGLRLLSEPTSSPFEMPPLEDPDEP